MKNQWSVVIHQGVAGMGWNGASGAVRLESLNTCARCVCHAYMRTLLCCCGTNDEQKAVNARRRAQQQRTVTGRTDGPSIGAVAVL